MAHITVKQGLDIPIDGEPIFEIRRAASAQVLGYNFANYDMVKFRCLVKEGDLVKLGQPIAEDKDVPGRFFVSPAGGIVQEVRRGEKRRLLAVIIKRAQQEDEISFPVDSIEVSKRQEIIQRLMEAGIFAHIRQRPFDRLANPHELPRSIFVKAVESAPFMPPPELQVLHHENEFEVGLQILRKLTSGQVHLCCREGKQYPPFSKAAGIVKHTVSGPHPAGNASVHIHNIDRIKNIRDIVWTVTVLDVISIGSLFMHGKSCFEQILSIAGPSVRKDDRKLYSVRKGQMVGELIQTKLESSSGIRIISGNPLTGDACHFNDVLGLEQQVLCAFPEGEKREFLHFFRLGGNKYTASGAYLSGHLCIKKRRWNFSTSQHGEERAFVDGSVYERVMPMRILPMQLVRAIMGDDRELAEELGLLEVHQEDFALPEFVCPCKVPMMDIVKNGLKQYCKDTFG